MVRQLTRARAAPAPPVSTPTAAAELRAGKAGAGIVGEGRAWRPSAFLSRVRYQCGCVAWGTEKPLLSKCRGTLPRAGRPGHQRRQLSPLCLPALQAEAGQLCQEHSQLPGPPSTSGASTSTPPFLTLR